MYNINSQAINLKQIICKRTKSYDQYNFLYELLLKTSLFSFIDSDRKKFEKFIQCVKFIKFKADDVILSIDANNNGVYILVTGAIYKFQKIDHYSLDFSHSIIKNEDKKQRIHTKQLIKLYGNLTKLIYEPFEIIHQQRNNSKTYIAKHDSQFLFVQYHYWNSFLTVDSNQRKLKFFKQYYPFLSNLEEKRLNEDLKLFEIQKFEHDNKIPLLNKIYFLYQGNLLVIDQQKNYQQLRHKLRKSLFQINKLHKIKISYILEGDVIGIQNYLNDQEFQYEVNSEKAKLYSINYQKIRYLAKQWICFFQYYQNNDLTKQRELSRHKRETTSLHLQQIFNQNANILKQRLFTKQQLQEKSTIDNMMHTYSKLRSNWTQIKKLKEATSINKIKKIPFKMIKSDLNEEKKNSLQKKEIKKSHTLYSFFDKRLANQKSHHQLLLKLEGKENLNFIKFNLFNQTFENY